MKKYLGEFTKAEISEITNQQDWNVVLELCPMSNNVCYDVDGNYKALDFNKEYIVSITKGNLTTLKRIQYNKITRLWKQIWNNSMRIKQED